MSMAQTYQWPCLHRWFSLVYHAMLTKLWRTPKPSTLVKVSRSLTLCRPKLLFQLTWFLVTVRFQPLPSAPILKNRVFKISASQKFETVVKFLRKKLDCKDTDSVFCYVNSVFAPGLDEGVGGLWRVSASNYFFYHFWLKGEYMSNGREYSVLKPMTSWLWLIRWHQHLVEAWKDITFNWTLLTRSILLTRSYCHSALLYKELQRDASYYRRYQNH